MSEWECTGEVRILQSRQRDLKIIEKLQQKWIKCIEDGIYTFLEDKTIVDELPTMLVEWRDVPVVSE